VRPAPKTTDWEFIRRVTLDLTGRIPQPGRVLSFVADTSPGKRAGLIDELLASPQWVDKWTMYFGDMFKNTVNRPSSSVDRFAAGRNAFYQWIHDALTQSSGVYPAYAMQLPDTAGAPGGTVAAFLDSFLRGNRDDVPRKGEGSVLQALNLMNDAMVESRLGTNVLLGTANLTLVALLPGSDEKAKALAALKNGNRNVAAQNLVWALYNKVDFIYNY
jgi:hypothetical protein